jgi:hypothetical protein
MKRRSSQSLSKTRDSQSAGSSKLVHVPTNRSIATGVYCKAFLAGLCVLFEISALARADFDASPSDKIPPLLPPRGEIPPTFWEQHGTLVIVGSILTLAVISAAIWLLTRPRPPVVVPPGTQAREALQDLGKHPEDGKVLSCVSQIVRYYVAAAFALPEGELTTSEFCRLITGHEPIGQDLTNAICGLLRRCDDRKFAPAGLQGTATDQAPLGAVDAALNLVEQAEARLTVLRQAEAAKVAQRQT